MSQVGGAVALAAFEGWNDAADAATSVLEHLASVWPTQPVATIDPDDYYDFQVNRPSVSLVDGVTRRIEWPTTRLERCHPGGQALEATREVPAPPLGAWKPDADLVLVRGLEPNMRWRDYCDELLGLLTELGVDTLVVLGALLADAPHTRPVPVTGTAGDAELAESLGLSLSRYEGPTGIAGVVAEAAHRAGLRSVSLWAAVPHYVAQPPCPKAALALVRRVEDLLGLTIPHAPLEEQARRWQRRVDELAREDREVADYVQALEQREPADELPEATGDAIAREFERYLRRRQS